MFFTYVFRELRRRHRQALLTALGLAVGVALVVAVTAYADGVGKAQDQVLQSLYGVGTDITVSQQQKMDQGGPQRFGMQPPDQSKQGQKFNRSAVMTSPGQQSISEKKLAQIASLDGVSAATGSITHERHEREGQVRAGAGRPPRAAPSASSQSSSAASSSTSRARCRWRPSTSRRSRSPASTRPISPSGP